MTVVAMPLSVECPECQVKLRLETPAAGASKVKCRRCGASFTVDAPPATVEAPATPPPVLPPGTVGFVRLTRDAAAAMAGRRRERKAEVQESTIEPRDRAVGLALLTALALAFGG